MAHSSIEETELTILLLEEIDSNFSSIRLSLRSMKMKIAKLLEQRKQMISNCSPWLKFFESEIKTEFSPFSELQISSFRKDIENSPDTFNYGPPKNPFIELESSDLLNKSTIKNIGKSIISEESSINNLCKTECDIDFTIANTTANLSEEQSETLRIFNINEIPEIFRQEKDLIDLYEYIYKYKTVNLEIIFKRFNQIPVEKLEIFISLLCRKNFIRQKNGKLIIEK